MTFRSTFSRLTLAAATAAPVFLAGCGNQSNTPEAQTAETAVGIKPTSETKKTVQVERDVIVEKDTKVIDKNTGQVLSEKKESTPIKIQEVKKETTNVKVDVGTTSSSVSPPVPPATK